MRPPDERLRMGCIGSLLIGGLGAVALGQLGVNTTTAFYAAIAVVFVLFGLYNASPPGASYDEGRRPLKWSKDAIRGRHDGFVWCATCGTRFRESDGRCPSCGTSTIDM